MFSPGKKNGFTTFSLHERGFTLVELLVVISIISILSVVGFVSFKNIQSKARDARMKADVNAIKKAYEANYDPSLNGGQGGYKPLTAANFASGKIPTPDGTTGTSYIVVGPDASGLNTSTNNFRVCAPLNGAASCTAQSATCYCGSSSGGSGTPTPVVCNTLPALVTGISCSATAPGPTIYVACPASGSIELTALNNCSNADPLCVTQLFTIYQNSSGGNGSSANLGKISCKPFYTPYTVTVMVHSP